MAIRRGAGKNRGKGYRNLKTHPKDPIIHSMSSRGIKQPQRCNPAIRHRELFVRDGNISEFLSIDKSKPVEQTATFTVNFPQFNQIEINEKPIYFAGHFKDLFKEGKHIQIFNGFNSELVRDLKLVDGEVIIDPQSGNPDDIIKVSEDTDLLYEEWLMDRGSILFLAPKGMVGTPQGTILKLSVEEEPIKIFRE